MGTQVQVYRGGEGGINPVAQAARLDSKDDYLRFARTQLAMKGFREDAGLTAAFARQLEHIISKVYAAQFAQYRAMEFFPVNTELGPGDLSFTYRMIERIGNAAVINGGNSKDLPNIDIGAQEWQAPIITLGASYNFNVIDQASAAKAQIAIEAEKAKASRESIEALEEQIWCSGYANTGVSGVTNCPGVAQVAQTSIANGNWATQIAAALATSPTTGLPYPAVGVVSAIASDLIAAKQAIFAKTLGRHNATHCLLPANLYSFLDTVPQSVAFTSKTLLTMLEEMTGLEFDYWPILLNVGSISTGSGSSISTLSSHSSTRICVYEKNPDVMQLMVAQPFVQLAPQAVGLVWEVPVYSRIGGAMSVRPLGFVYIDGC